MLRASHARAWEAPGKHRKPTRQERAGARLESILKGALRRHSGALAGDVRGLGGKWLPTLIGQPLVIVLRSFRRRYSHTQERGRRRRRHISFLLVLGFDELNNAQRAPLNQTRQDDFVDN